VEKAGLHNEVEEAGVQNEVEQAGLENKVEDFILFLQSFQHHTHY